MTKAMTFEEVSPAEVERLMSSDKWAAETKLDGVRCVAEISNGVATLMNRNGKPLAAASTNAHRPAIKKALEAAFGEGLWVVDGEIMSDGHYWLFDVILADSMHDARAPLHERRETLEAMATLFSWDAPDSLIRVVTQAVDAQDKQMLLDSIIRIGGEGVMLKHVDAPYAIGKRVRTGLKLKLTKTVDAVVTERDSDDHTNAHLAVYKDGVLVDIGKCSMLGKADAQVGDVVEVKFLYVGANGRLYQPRMLRIRDDKLPGECLYSQLDNCHVNKAVAA
jgi:ATP-dependent DNA ligase